jgi:hypothetical protein
VGTVPVFASAAEAMQMVRAGLDYLAAADATAMAAQTRVQCLRELEQAHSVATVARFSILGAFTAGQDYADDADYSARAWLIHKTGVTPGAAVAHTAWVRRAAAHPLVVAALAAGRISESMARMLCLWTGKLPQDRREKADEILLAAAADGLGLADLAGLCAEICERSQAEEAAGDAGDAGDAGEPDAVEDETFEDRALRLVTTLGGAGVLHGDLTPECAAAVGAVLDALSGPAGAEDTRTREQRCHDALQEAMRRLAAAGMVPERAGQPMKVWVHIPLAELLQMEGSTTLVQEWVASMRTGWAAHRAQAAEGGGDGGAWLDGDAARAVACDAAIAPVITGEVNLGAMDELVRLCVQLDRLRDGRPDDASTGDASTGDASDDSHGDCPESQAAPAAETTQAWEALEQAVIGKALDLLSGPGGLASFLRRRQLGVRLGGPSLPLDIGYSDTIPAGIRNAVILRDKRCRWAGGCNQPASACEVHHVRHKADGGKTSTKECVLLCFFHHHVVIHRWGWTLVLNPDGTTTAWNKDRTKVLHSHGPPARPG